MMVRLQRIFRHRSCTATSSTARASIGRSSAVTTATVSSTISSTSGTNTLVRRTCGLLFWCKKRDVGIFTKYFGGPDGAVGVCVHLPGLWTITFELNDL